MAHRKQLFDLHCVSKLVDGFDERNFPAEVPLASLRLELLLRLLQRPVGLDKGPLLASNQTCVESEERRLLRALLQNYGVLPR